MSRAYVGLCFKKKKTGVFLYPIGGPKIPETAIMKKSGGKKSRLKEQNAFATFTRKSLKNVELANPAKGNTAKRCSTRRRAAAGTA